MAQADMLACEWEEAFCALNAWHKYIHLYIYICITARSSLQSVGRFFFVQWILNVGLRVRLYPRVNPRCLPANGRRSFVGSTPYINIYIYIHLYIYNCTRQPSETVHIQREHEHTRTRNRSKSGFGSLRRLPLNISRCLGGGSRRRDPSGRLRRRPAAPRVRETLLFVFLCAMNSQWRSYLSRVTGRK